MSNFTFRNIFNSLFADNSTSMNKIKRRNRKRTCRIEELESREMLHAGFLGSVLDIVPLERAGDVAVLRAVAGDDDVVGGLRSAPSTA